MKHLLTTILATSALSTISGAAMAGDTKPLYVPIDKQLSEVISVEVNFDRSVPIAETYKLLELKIRRTCRKAYRKTTRTYKNRAVFDCQKALMEKAVQVSEMPTLLAYHNDQINRG